MVTLALGDRGEEGQRLNKAPGAFVVLSDNDLFLYLDEGYLNVTSLSFVKKFN